MRVVFPSRLSRLAHLVVKARGVGQGDAMLGDCGIGPGGGQSRIGSNDNVDLVADHGMAANADSEDLGQLEQLIPSPPAPMLVALPR